MNFIIRNDEKFILMMDIILDLVDFGEVKFVIDDEVWLKILFCWKFLFVIKDRIKIEFDKLVDRGIFVLVII